MRRWGLALIAVAVLLSGCGGSSKPHVWVTRPYNHNLTACVSNDCGPYSATLHWGPLGFPSTTGYYISLNGSQVADVAASPYTFVGIDCGTTSTLSVQPHNGSGGTGPVYSSSYTTPACGGGGTPVNTAAPAITDSTNPGLYESGDVLSASTGSWTNSPTSYSYQWMDEDTVISGATSSTYTLASSDLDHTVDVEITATNGSGTSNVAFSASSGVIVNACNITTANVTTAVGDINSGHSGQTICLSAGTYAPGTISGNNAAMTTLEAAPGATVTLSNQPVITANNFRIEGFVLSGGLTDNGAGNVNVVGNYYHDAGANGALWYANGNDTTSSTVKELHNRMINVQTNGSTFDDGWGFYGCDVNGQHYVQDYNTFNTMNQHPLQLAGCATIEAIGNEYLNIWDQYSSQHADCLEIWGGAGTSTIQDNRCTTQTPVPSCPGVAGGTCGSDMLLSGDSGPFTVTNNLISNSPKQCLDDTPNGTFNGSMTNGVLENNTITNCAFGELDMTGGSSTGNTAEFNVASITGNGNCSQFTTEDFNNGSQPHCPGTHDTNVTPTFTSTEPSDPGATYATSNVNSAWGYQVGCTSLTVCHGRVGYDAHIPTP